VIFIFLILVLKGRHILTQGEALCYKLTDSKALKGRNITPFQGFYISRYLCRASPYFMIYQPFGPKDKQQLATFNWKIYLAFSGFNP